MTLLAVDNLRVTFATPDGVVAAVNDISFALNAGGTLGIVGESGSGKSQTVLAIMGLLAANASVSGSVGFDGEQILGLANAPLNRIRGNRIAMIFQDPMTSLNPYLTLETQMTEVLKHHRRLGGRAARRRAVETLDAVQLPSAARQLGRYPHELSGGQRQRVMIAMALLCGPDLLIADEPTTALDVTVQAQILALLRDLKDELGMAMILITHDLGVVAGICDEIVVMYGGQVMEHAGLDDLFYLPQHPYTRALLNSVPRLDDATTGRLVSIPGNPPDPMALPPGCPFEPRCSLRLDRCATDRPQPDATVGGSIRACHLAIMP